MGENPPQIRTVAVSFLYLAIGIILAIAFPLVGVKPLIKHVQLAQGISIFAVAYLDAQFIERIVEPFSVMGLKNDAKKDNEKKNDEKSGKKAAQGLTPFGNWREIDRLERLEKKDKLADDESARLTELKAQRMFSIWGFASLLGIVLAYLAFGLFQIVGITFNPIGPIPGHVVDAILSGVIIGGGTKPLHDFIEYLQEPKSKS